MDPNQELKVYRVEQSLFQRFCYYVKDNFRFFKF